MLVIDVNGTTLLVSGRFVRLARIYDEDWLERNATGDPEKVVRNIANSGTGIDIFTFAQALPETSPRYNYYMEWDNVAAVHIASFDDWWTKKLPQGTRQNVRRAERRGVVVRVCDLDDEFVRGIVKIYNETPIRQGRRFWHYGKAFDTVRKENSTFLDRCAFLGAYYNDELIGFLKVVFIDRTAKIMQILSMVRHQDKRPTNALIAKTMELCSSNNMEYFIYGKYVYGKRTRNSVIQFKERNGFEKFEIPRYYVPFSLKGKLFLKLGLHHGVIAMLPENVIESLASIRAKWYEKTIKNSIAKSE